MGEKIKAFKGFNKDLQCRGFQYEVGKEYEEKSADLCHAGFHACEYPLDVFGYYPPNESRFCEVELDATEQKDSDDSKRVGKSIKLTAEIGFEAIVEAAIKFTFERAKWNKGDTAKQERGAASATGDYGAASATGFHGAASATGFQGAASATGDESVAMASGREGKAKGAKGCVLFLIERDSDWHIIAHKSLKVDGKRYKANTYYSLQDGKVVEVE